MIRAARPLMTAALAAVLLTPAVPALGQSDEQSRIRKLEAEVSALQRRVFPGGDGRYFEPEIGGTATPATTTAGVPSTTALTDILARLDAIETSLQSLTGQVELNTNTLAGLSTRLDAIESSGAGSAVSANAGVSTGGTATAPTATTSGSNATGNNLLAMTGGASASGSATPATTSAASATPAAASGPSAARLSAVQAIAKPQTDDAGDDEYSYGFRLWDAGFYPEAQQQLTMFVEEYPSHWRTTYGRNLLGRAYLDDGKPREAAPWFLNNYQADRNAARSPDSLLYLAESMIAMDDENRACIALAEFGETYPAIAAGRLQSQYEANRAKVSCSG